MTKRNPNKRSSEQTVRNIRRATRRQYSAEEKIRIEYKSDKGPFSTKFNLRQWITDNSSSDTEGIKRVNAGIW